MASSAPEETDLTETPEPEDVPGVPDHTDTPVSDSRTVSGASVSQDVPSDKTSTADKQRSNVARHDTDQQNAEGDPDFSSESKVNGSKYSAVASDPEDVPDVPERNDVTGSQDQMSVADTQGDSRTTDVSEAETVDGDASDPSDVTRPLTADPKHVRHPLRQSDTLISNVDADVTESEVVDDATEPSGTAATNDDTDAPGDNHVTAALKKGQTPISNAAAIATAAGAVSDASQPDESDPKTATNSPNPDPKVVTDSPHGSGVTEVLGQHDVTSAGGAKYAASTNDPRNRTSAPDLDDVPGAPSPSVSTGSSAVYDRSTDEASPSNQTECPICHKDFNDPKILPCAHTLCRDCLVTWLRSRYPDPRSHCPVCRSQITGSKGLAFTTCEEFADALPSDLAMVILVQSAKVLRKAHVCCVCPDVAATSVCLNCSDMLCEACAGTHKILSATRHHEVQGLTALTAERLSAIRPATCPSHPDKTCELFCSTHVVAVCHVCATSKHRECPKVEEMEEKVKEARAMLGEMSAMLRSGETALEEDIRQLDRDLQVMEKTTSQAMWEVEAVCARLEESVKSCRRRLKQEIQAKHSDASNPIGVKKSSVLEQLGKLSSHRQLVDRADRTTPEVELWTVASTLQTCIQGLDLSVPESTNAVSLEPMKVDQTRVAEIEKLLAGLSVTEVSEDSSATKPVSPHDDAHVHQDADVSNDNPTTDPVLPVTTRRFSFLRNKASRGPVFRFHSNHPKNITLGMTRQSARRTGVGGIVLSADPLKKDYLYEIRVDQTGGSESCCLMVGVTDEDPASLILPYSAAPHWTFAVIVIGPQAIWRRGVEEECDAGRELQYLRVGSRVGLLVDAVGCLHLYVGGRDQGVVARDVPKPCYAIFDMFNDSCKKISVLPVE